MITDMTPEMKKYETELRAKLAEAEAEAERQSRSLANTELHPNSNNYQWEKTSAVLAQGTLMGLIQALCLWLDDTSMMEEYGKKMASWMVRA